MNFQDLSQKDRRYALTVAQGKCHRLAYVLEKDIWVVATLRSLSNSPFSDHLVFKGGTSLSKAWGAITRFSEDVDITYDIRSFAPDLVSQGDDELLPRSRSQVKRWTDTIRVRLAEWVKKDAREVLLSGLNTDGFNAEFRAENNRLYVTYKSLFDDSDFIRPEVMIAFGARSTGEPHKIMRVACDAAPCLPDLVFPVAQPKSMLATRTFWEKATAIHVYCNQKRYRGERLSRHWYDLSQLDSAGLATAALLDRDLAIDVAKHKSLFFREKDSSGSWIDYANAVTGRLKLVPDSDLRAVLENDYEKMLSDGMLFDEDTSFDTLIDNCSDLEARANNY